jgi:hypothetical protein
MNCNGMYVNNNKCLCRKNYSNSPRQMSTCPNLNIQYSPAAFTINGWGTYLNDESFPNDNPLGLRIRAVPIVEIIE